MAKTVAPRPQIFNYPLGVSLAVCGGIALSAGGLLIRSIDTASGWQILVYRSASFVLLLLAIIAIRYRGGIIQPFLEIGGSGVVIGAALGTGFATYVFAVLSTSVANVMFVLACAPIFSAIIARVVLGEVLSIRVWGIMLVAVAGIVIMVAGDLSPGRLSGNLFALTAAMAFAIMVVLLRRAGQKDMLPATCLGGVFAFAVASIAAVDFSISSHDLIVSVLLGTMQVGIGFICLTYAPRFILAAEVALLSLLEPILAPLWVWLVYEEVPAQATLFGGAIVLVCILMFVAMTLSDQRKSLRG